MVAVAILERRPARASLVSYALPRAKQVTAGELGGMTMTREDDGPAVWLIDSDQWPRALLRAELIERGYDAIGFTSVEEAIGRLAVQRGRRPRLVLVDLAGQALTRGGVALLSAGDVPVIGIAGAVDAAGAPERLGLSALMRRPVSLGDIADAVARTLAR
jgi:DNA-binding NtrC family response regulator